MRRSTTPLPALFFLVQIAGCHLLYPFDATVSDSDTSPVADASPVADGPTFQLVELQQGTQPESFSLALDSKGRAHLVYLLKRSLQHAVVDKGAVVSDEKLAQEVDAAEVAINDQDLALVVYSKKTPEELWRTARDLRQATSTWSSPALNGSHPAAYDAIELTSSGLSFYGAFSGVDSSGQHVMVLSHVSTNAVGCSIKPTQSPAPLRVAAGAGVGAVSYQEDKQWRLLASKLTTDQSFCQVKYGLEPKTGAYSLPLVVDSTGKIHSLATSGGALQHVIWDSAGNKLSTHKGFTLPAQSQAFLDLALDKLDRIHILYQDGSRLLWRYSTSATVWSVPTQVAAGLTVTTRARIRVRAGRVGLAFRLPGGGMGYLQASLP